MSKQDATTFEKQDDMLLPIAPGGNAFSTHHAKAATANP
jgi:hypothetical protein